MDLADRVQQPDSTIDRQDLAKYCLTNYALAKSKERTLLIPSDKLTPQVIQNYYNRFLEERTATALAKYILLEIALKENMVINLRAALYSVEKALPHFFQGAEIGDIQSRLGVTLAQAEASLENDFSN